MLQQKRQNGHEPVKRTLPCPIDTVRILGGLHTVVAERHKDIGRIAAGQKRLI